MTTFQINILNPEAEKVLLDLEDRKLISISKKEDIYELHTAQKEMLLLSEEDIAYGRIISEEELDAFDKEWLS